MLKRNSVDKKNNIYAKIFIKNENFFIKVNINNYNYIYTSIITLYQALLQKGWYLPRFCFHVKLSIAGNCRMCFIELKNVNKPIISCSTNISNNQIVFTNTLLTFKSRENILEFILINHPIDCPICDQGGECDLQDQYVVFGSLNSRFYENFKKSTKNKNISYLIKLSLNKCINCSRCTRFSQQIIGDYSFSLIGRGENSNISNYTKSFYNSEISANVMDLCPVGALTSKIISYDFRIWELIDLKYVDLNDVLLPPIRIDFRGLKILRVLPLVNSNTNEEWISNKLRYGFKFFFKNRFYLPRVKKLNIFLVFSWTNVLNLLKNLCMKLFIFFSKKKLFFLKNINFNKNKLDLYSYSYYNFFFKKFNFLTQNIFSTRKFNANRGSFLVKNKDTDFLKTDIIFIFFINFRYFFPLFNYKLREKMIFDYIDVFVFGSVLNLNYFFNHVGNFFLYFKNFFKKKKIKKKNYVMFFNEKETYLLNLFTLVENSKLYNMPNSNFKILNKELGGIKNILYNNFINYFSFMFLNSSKFVIKNKFFSSIKLLFSQNFRDLKNFNLIVPKKFNFEQNSLLLNVFGMFNDFTFLSYKSDHKTLKNDWSFFSLFFKKLNFKGNLKLSVLKSKFIPKKWVYTFYNLIFKFNFFFFSELKNFSLKIFNTSKKSVFNNKNNFSNFYEYLLLINRISWLF